MPKPRTYTDQDITLIKPLYYAWFTPKEAADYLHQQHGKRVSTSLITRIYAALKLTDTPRFNKINILSHYES